MFRASTRAFICMFTQIASPDGFPAVVKWSRQDSNLGPADSYHTCFCTSQLSIYPNQGLPSGRYRTSFHLN